MINLPDTNGRRNACLIVSAHKGDHRAARGVIGRAIREGLPVTRWGTAPHFVYYTPTSSDGDARYTLDATDTEFARVGEALVRISQEEGWSRPPVDCYHD